MNDRYAAFLRVIDPQDNATGGGAASAVAGAMAAALVGMVARVSIGKPNMLESDTHYASLNEAAQLWMEELFAGSNADSLAFDAVMTAYRLPRMTDAEKAARSGAIQFAIIGATEVPLQNAERCAYVLAAARSLAGHSNANAASDLECAVYLAISGLKGALSNADTNISAIKDAETRARLSAQAAALRQLIDSDGSIPR